MLKIANLSKENGKRIVLSKINVEISNGEFVCFLGPTGSGKTALLRIIAGLEKADNGKILLKGEDISNFPAYKRKVNTVFNSFSLFPDLDLYENIEFGLNFKNISSEEKERIVYEAIEMFELTPYLHYNVNNLDNLIKYKIALCRALVNNPLVLLLDDSLKLLDNKDTLKMRYELKRLQNKLKKTFIYITDDLQNAFSLADKIGILQHGVLHQYDTPKKIYEKPQTYFVASYIGNMNFFYAKIINSVDGHYVVEIDDKFLINVPIVHNFDKNRDLFYAIRPERMSISYDENAENKNIFKGKIIQKDYRAEYTQYYVELDYGKIIVVSELNYNFLLRDEMINFYEIGEEIFVKWSVLSGDIVYA
jgi:spermidine/putrescine transport system ATP-binding protein